MRIINKRIHLYGLMLMLFITYQPLKAQTFTNPLLNAGADPWSIYKDGFYYYTHTLQDSIVIWKTKNLADLKTAERKTIFVPPAGTNYSKEIWAPEIHFINDKWYVYFAGDDGDNQNHRMYVLENDAKNPFDGKFTLKGKIHDKILNHL